MIPGHIHLGRRATSRRDVVRTSVHFSEYWGGDPGGFWLKFTPPSLLDVGLTSGRFGGVSLYFLARHRVRH